MAVKDGGGGRGEGGNLLLCNFDRFDIGAVIMHCLEGEACITVEKTDGIQKMNRHRQKQPMAS